MAPPIKYKPEFCEQLIDHMSGGLSFESFGGIIRVGRDTLYQWRKKRRAFSDAVDVGASLSRLYFEQVGIAIMTGQTMSYTDERGTRHIIDPKKFNTQMYSLQVRNRFPGEWSERINVAPINPEGQNPSSFTEWVAAVSKRAKKQGA